MRLLPSLVRLPTRARLFISAVQQVLRVCIVGSGPAGFYTADKLVKALGDGVKVDLVDRLPTPFGLVRSGVAPDHADTKNVVNQFSGVAQAPAVSYRGNVAVGTDITLQELRQAYHAVVLAYGAESDRPLRIPGEDSRGVFAAREFVWWYNGHPDGRQLPVDLSKVESVAVCGIGNVALDCARVLMRPPEQLATTDIALHALRQLQGSSRVREVHLCARRGPVQAACAPKELKELVNLPNIAVHAAPGQLTVSEQDVAEMKATRMKRRIFDLISSAAGKQYPGAQRQLHFQFYRQPVEVLADSSGQVTGLKVEVTQLQVVPGRGTVAVGTGVHETYPVQLVLKSIGYKSLPLEGVAFDAGAGIIPNLAGRVLQGVGLPHLDPGLYVCGWVKRGPTGIIGTNLTDAEETVACLVADRDQLLKAAAGPAAAGGWQQVEALLQQRGVQVVDWEGWGRIDAAEVAAGQRLGKVREKLVDVPNMLAEAAAAGASAGAA